MGLKTASFLAGLFIGQVIAYAMAGDSAAGADNCPAPPASVFSPEEMDEIDHMRQIVQSLPVNIGGRHHTAAYPISALINQLQE